MYYRESGDFKTSYQADNQFISVYQDKILVSIIIFLFWLVLPFWSTFWILSGTFAREAKGA